MLNSWMNGLLSSITLFALVSLPVVQGCGDSVCNDYGVEPRFDDSDRPPNAVVLGRATWTVLHTTAAYLPDKLNEDEKDGFFNIVRSIALIYPGDGQAIVSEIYNDGMVQKELEAIETKEDAMLWAWKFHNAVSNILLRT
jgi:hypothetical protein